MALFFDELVASGIEWSTKVFMLLFHDFCVFELNMAIVKVRLCFLFTIKNILQE